MKGMYYPEFPIISCSAAYCAVQDGSINFFILLVNGRAIHNTIAPRYSSVNEQNFNRMFGFIN